MEEKKRNKKRANKLSVVIGVATLIIALFVNIFTSTLYKNELVKTIALNEQVINQQKEVIESQREIITLHEQKTQTELNCTLAFVKCGDEVSEVVDNRFEALVQATWRLETGNGTSNVWRTLNNPGGVFCGVDYCVYESQEHGMAALRILLTEYVDKYGYDLKAIRDRYCACEIETPHDLAVFTQLFNEELEKLGGN